MVLNKRFLQYITGHLTQPSFWVPCEEPIPQTCLFSHTLPPGISLTNVRSRFH
jgi:hypothetical protein